MVTSHRPGTTRERVLHRGERVAHEIAHDRGTERVLRGQGRGTYVLRLDRDSGALTPVVTTRGVTNPSYLAFDPTGRFLYAVNEVKVTDGTPSGTVSAFALDRRSGVSTGS